MGRREGTTQLSQWEVDELLYYHRGGWQAFELASYYGISERTVTRILTRERKKDVSEGAARRGRFPA